jgi:hypothetical protein
MTYKGVSINPIGTIFFALWERVRLPILQVAFLELTNKQGVGSIIINVAPKCSCSLYVYLGLPQNQHFFIAASVIMSDFIQKGCLRLVYYKPPL